MERLDPGRIREVVPVSLPHPRDYNAPTFQAMVQRLRNVFVSELLRPSRRPPAREESEPYVSEEAPAQAAAAALEAAKLEPLPAVTLSEVLGVTEVLKQHAGEMDVFALDEVTDYDFGRTLSVVKAGEMLEFLDTPGNRVLLTETGQTLLAGDANARKQFSRRWWAGPATPNCSAMSHKRRCSTWISRMHRHPLGARTACDVCPVRGIAAHRGRTAVRS